jgi:predicted secreted Zn-dependent protease
MTKWTVTLCAGLLCVAMAGPSLAQPQAKTSYTYYSVSGNSAAALYDSMLRRGPHVNGAKAYAATSMNPTQQGRMIQGQSCRIADYSIKANFVIRLPKMSNETALKGETLARWQQFSSFLRKHEETHRTIWMGCASELESRIAAMRAPNCTSLDRKAAALWASIKKQCDRKHDAFDTTEQLRLIKHPFVRMVLRKPSRTTRVAAASSKRKRAFSQP